MNFLYSVFFAAGIAAFIYSKMGKRIGYQNGQQVWLLVGVVFIISLIVFMTILSMINK